MEPMKCDNIDQWLHEASFNVPDFHFEFARNSWSVWWWKKIPENIISSSLAVRSTPPTPLRERLSDFRWRVPWKGKIWILASFLVLGVIQIICDTFFGVTSLFPPVWHFILKITVCNLYLEIWKCILNY